MKKPRHLTPEERRLWRESNRLTMRWEEEEEFRVESLESSEEDEGRAVVPPPVGGRLGGGRKMATTLPATPSLPRHAAAKKPPLAALSTREANRAFKPYPIDATLDLHGLTRLEALARVESFLHHQHRAHRRHVVIITGKGRGSEEGVLRKYLPDWLNEPALRPLISAFAAARPEKGGTGVTHVLLKRPYPVGGGS